MSAAHWLGPYNNADDALNELRKSVAEIIGEDPETWPDHGNAPLAIAVTLALARRTNPAPAQEPVAVPAKKLYPAHPRALRASIAELDMWLDSSDTLDEIENQQSFGESIMLVVHELKRLQAVIAAAPVSPPTDHSEDTLDMVKAPPADSGEVERLREAVETANKAIAEYIRYLDGGEMRGSYDGKPERDGLRKAEYATRFALKQTLGGSHA